jgi:hypothetical protein
MKKILMLIMLTTLLTTEFTAACGSGVYLK